MYSSFFGSFGYDDEGVEAQRVDLIKDGILVGFQTSRETAAAVGAKRVLVRGYDEPQPPVDHVADDLLAAARWLIARAADEPTR